MRVAAVHTCFCNRFRAAYTNLSPRPILTLQPDIHPNPAAVDEMAAPDQHPDTYRAWQYINIILTDSQIFVPIMDLVRHKLPLQSEGVAFRGRVLCGADHASSVSQLR